MQPARQPGEENAARHSFVGAGGMTGLDRPPVLAARGDAWVPCGCLGLRLGVEEDFRPAHEVHPGILVTGLDGVVERHGAAGHTVTWDSDFPGFRRV